MKKGKYGAFSFIKLLLKYNIQHIESAKIIIEFNEVSQTEPSQLRSRECHWPLLFTTTLSSNNHYLDEYEVFLNNLKVTAFGVKGERVIGAWMTSLSLQK